MHSARTFACPSAQEPHPGLQKLTGAAKEFGIIRQVPILFAFKTYVFKRNFWSPVGSCFFINCAMLNAAVASFPGKRLGGWKTWAFWGAQVADNFLFWPELVGENAAKLRRFALIQFKNGNFLPWPGSQPSSRRHGLALFD